MGASGPDDEVSEATHLATMYDAFVAVADARPGTRRVDVIRGDIDGTLERLIAAADRR